MPIHTPYEPESQIAEFGWLWLTDGPMGPDWHLVQTIEDEGDGPLMTWFVGDGDGHTSDCSNAEHYRGLPYVSCNAPTAVPGKSDALEVAIRMSDGLSATLSFGDAAGDATLARVKDALRLDRQDEGAT